MNPLVSSSFWVENSPSFYGYGKVGVNGKISSFCEAFSIAFHCHVTLLESTGGEPKTVKKLACFSETPLFLFRDLGIVICTSGLG